MGIRDEEIELSLVKITSGPVYQKFQNQEVIQDIARVAIHS